MPPISRTALVLSNRGDPIFGAIAGAIRGGIRVIRGVVRAVRGSQAVGSQATQIATRARGAITTIARSRTGRVLAEAGAIGAATAVGVRVGARGPGATAPGFTVEGGFQIGPNGCPTGKIVDVAAHQRIIPLDRFGRPRRRIDVLNTKALARATRRLGGFQKRARRVEKQLARIAPRSRSRRRSKGVC